MSPQARAALAAKGRAAWIGDWQPAYKVSDRVDRAAETRSTFDALLFADADLPGVVQELTALGGQIVSTSSNGTNKLVRFQASGPQIAGLAGLAGVEWIEPHVTPMLDNVDAQWVVQTN